MSTLEQVRSTIAATLKVPEEKISATTRSEDLAAWDSLGHVNLIMALEQTFQLFLDVEDFPKLNSVPAIMDYLREHGVE